MLDHFEGNRFDIILDGEKKSGSFQRGSEYCTYSVEDFWYQGSGKILDKSNNQESIFLFRTWAVEAPTSQRILRDYVLISDRASYGRYPIRNPMKNLLLVEGREKNLIDLLAERILTAISMDKRNLIPVYSFRQLSHNELVLNGFVPSEEGQIHLPNLATI